MYSESKLFRPLTVCAVQICRIAGRNEPTYLVVEGIVGGHDVEELAPDELLHYDVAGLGALFVHLPQNSF